MDIRIYTKGRTSQYFAEGFYTDGRVKVCKGAKLARFKAETQIPEYIKGYLEDTDLVDENNFLLKDCDFTSASHAALFVTGNISNGLRVWKTEDGKYLRDSIKN